MLKRTLVDVASGQLSNIREISNTWKEVEREYWWLGATTPGSRPNKEAARCCLERVEEARLVTFQQASLFQYRGRPRVILDAEPKPVYGKSGEELPVLSEPDLVPLADSYAPQVQEVVNAWKRVDSAAWWFEVTTPGSKPELEAARSLLETIEEARIASLRLSSPVSYTKEPKVRLR